MYANGPGLVIDGWGGVGGRGYLVLVLKEGLTVKRISYPHSVFFLAVASQKTNGAL